MPSHLTRLSILAGLLLAAVASARAQNPQRMHEIAVDDYLSVYLLTDCAVSPDGRQVAYTELRWAEADEPRTTEMWTVSTSEPHPVRLTFDRVSADSPQWSPDGRELYYLTKCNRGDKKPPFDGTRQVWVKPPQPGEVRQVTRVTGGVLAYQLARDGRSLWYTKAGAEAEQDWKEMRGRYKDIEFGDGAFKYTELWKLDLEGWREEKIVAPKRVINEFRASADGRRVAMITSPDDRGLTKEGQSRVDVYDAQTQQTITLPEEAYRADAPSPYGWIEHVAWSDDGTLLAFTIGYDGYQTEVLIAEFGGDQPTVWKLKRPDELTVGDKIAWQPGTHNLCFLAQDHARQRLYSVPIDRGNPAPKAAVLTPGDVVVFAFSFAADGKHFAAITSTIKEVGDVYWCAVGEAATTRLTRANPQVDTWKLPQISVVNWKAPDGTDVEGVLELPIDYEPAKGPLPMVVELHGGPTDATLFNLRYWIYGRTLFAARGYALLSPNYRGSTGYGDKFMTDLIGHEGDVEVKDILAGVDALIERGIADPERLGVMGWSNGGFLVNCLITTTPRFKAASTGAGVVDMFMQWGTEDTPNHVVNYLRGLPWQQPEAYVKASPAYRLGNITTPTIIHVGENDERVPAVHARALYRALKDYTHVPTVLLVYPGAGHGLAVSDHRKGKLDWDLAWFDRYLLGKQP